MGFWREYDEEKARSRRSGEDFSSRTVLGERLGSSLHRAIIVPEQSLRWPIRRNHWPRSGFTPKDPATRSQRDSPFLQQRPSGL